MPCAQLREKLKSVIGELSIRFGTPSFVPHVTLCSGIWKRDERELFETVEPLAAKLPVELFVDGMDWANSWSTFFFLKLWRAQNLFKEASGMIEGAQAPAIGPHLSLMYRFKPLGIEREALSKELADCLPSMIRFDQLALVRPAVGCWDDIASWEIVRCFR